jgi:hypothetical protein
MRSSGQSLWACSRGPLHLRNNFNALAGVHKATLRTHWSKTYRKHSVEVLAFGGDPYEPLEKAINVSEFRLIWQVFPIRQRDA